MNKQVLALFDFDGTITRKDTLPQIIRYIKGDVRFLSGLCQFGPTLVKYKAGLLTNSQAKEKLMELFFTGNDLHIFQQACDDFGLLKLQMLIRKDAMQCIRDHQRKNHRVIVISASCENWLAAWCKQTGIECIGTRLEVDGLQLTGRFLGSNCYGLEKVKRLKEIADLTNYTSIFAYGDSKGDTELLKIATHPNYRVFKN